MATTDATKDTTKKAENLMELHHAAEASWATFSYAKPDGVSAGKGFVALGRKDIVRGVVQIVKKHGGENNLHYHTGIASFWMVLKGRVRSRGAGSRARAARAAVLPRRCAAASRSA